MHMSCMIEFMIVYDPMCESQVHGKHAKILMGCMTLITDETERGNKRMNM